MNFYNFVPFWQLSAVILIFILELSSHTHNQQRALSYQYYLHVVWWRLTGCSHRLQIVMVLWVDRYCINTISFLLVEESIFWNRFWMFLRQRNCFKHLNYKHFLEHLLSSFRQNWKVEPRRWPAEYYFWIVVLYYNLQYTGLIEWQWAYILVLMSSSTKSSELSKILCPYFWLFITHMYYVIL